MTAAKMARALCTGHKTHSDEIGFLAHITAFFSFGFWHFSSPSSWIRERRSSKIDPDGMRRRHSHGVTMMVCRFR
jgi:hypothetical protein